MRRVVILTLVIGGLVASMSAGCESDNTDAEPQSYAGTSGTAGHDAGGSGGADVGGAGGADAGGAGGSSGGWPTGGSTAGGAGGQAGTAGSAGTPTGGAAGSATGGGAGTATGGAAGAGGEPCEGQGGSGGPCAFPQGVAEPDFFCAATAYQDTDPSVDAAVNAVMATLSGCNPGSDCTITGFPGATTDEICQSWFLGVAQALRDQGYCAGQHELGYTDEIAVSNTGCTGKWYGYHICNYGGGKVVWNPGARRGWWMIEPSYCPP